MQSKSAPRVFVSYSHDSSEHRECVLGLIQALRRNGIDAWADFFEENKPPAIWPVWMRTQVGEADYVIAVITETYARRYNQQEEPGVGAGVRWEATLITADIYYSTSKQTKYIPVVFSAEDTRHIPPPLNLTNKYLVVPDDDSSLLPLLRHLLQSPEFIPAQLGETPELPSSDGASTKNNPANDSRITAALQLSEQDPAKAIDDLTTLLDSLHGSQRAVAYCAIGEINQRMGFWAPALTAYQRALESNPDKRTAEVAAHNLSIALAGMDAHFRDGGPVDTANKFVQAVKKKRFDRAWNLLTPTLRLVLAQSWVWANKDHPNLASYDPQELAKSLSATKPNHKLAKDFTATQLREFRSLFSSIDETWGAASNPRPIGIDYELVLLSPTGGDVVIFDEHIGPLQTRPFLVKQIMGQWRVDSFTSAYPIPGWPPSREEISPKLTKCTIVEPTEVNEAEDG